MCGCQLRGMNTRRGLQPQTMGTLFAPPPETHAFVTHPGV